MTGKLLRVSIVAAFMAVIACSAVARAQAVPVPGPCTDGTLPGGAKSRICTPIAGWNHELVLFAHGYVRADEPLQFANLTLPDGTSLPTLVQSLGYAFATTTYRQNGLAILEGAADIQELVAAFDAAHGVPTKTYLTGASEGGLVTALLAEQPQARHVFSSALATCGPIGSFQAQIDYFGDFRVLFDYYFPGILPPSAINVPQSVMANWYTQYVPSIVAAVTANPGAAVELLRVAHAPYDPANPPTVVQTILDVLWYNVFATNDATAKLGGNPYGNRFRWYFGSSNDLKLNLSVARYTESPVAAFALRPYETTGLLRMPLVTLHTTRDDIVPFWQELLYYAKLDPFGRTQFTPLPVSRYGHCTFTANELLAAFQVTITR
jgi:fermentation-respiration switch protein FrsA (DUF1100 family)